ARGHNDDLAITRDGNTLLFTRMSAVTPNELYIAGTHPPNGTTCKDEESALLECNPPQTKQLTHINDAILSQVEMPKLEPFWFTGSEKAKVEGFLIKPPTFDPKQKYPMKFLIHGGPQGAWGDSW